MARPASTRKSIAEGVYAAHPHLDPDRDGRTVDRLAELYRLIDKVHTRLDGMPSAPFVDRGSGKSVTVDEYHKLCGDVLRLEQELGLTPASRTRLGVKGDAASPLGSAKV